MKRRMKAGWTVLALAGWAASMSSAWAQGSLTPPGAPAPTMKTLEQVEPRTPIGSAPYTISQPGSYYLTTNLACSGNGVYIGTNGVTLDLMGFTIAGNRAAGTAGVLVSPAATQVRSVVVRNGIIRNFASGVIARNVRGCRFEHLVVAGNSGQGLYFDSMSGECIGNTVVDCAVSENGGNGVHFSNYNGRGNGNAVVDCAISSNSFDGIVLSGNSGQCEGNRIVGCSVSRNGYIGIHLPGGGGQCTGNTIANCAISGNGSVGILLVGTDGQCTVQTIARCDVIGNGSFGVQFDGSSGQCQGNTLTDCTVAKNGNHGIYLLGSSGICNRNVIANCRVMNNVARGIYLAGVSDACEGNVVRDCVLGGNEGIGLSLYFANGNRLQGNHCEGQTGPTTYGLMTDSCQRNLVLGNTCIGHTNNFSISPNDTYGPIVTSTGPLATTGADAHPWANFSR